MARGHAVATVIEDTTHQDGGRLRNTHMPFPSIFGELGLDGVERGAVEDRLMLARVYFTLIDHLANVEAVLEEMLQGTDAIPRAPNGSATRVRPNFRDDMPSIE